MDGQYHQGYGIRPSRYRTVDMGTCRRHRTTLQQGNGVSSACGVSMDSTFTYGMHTDIILPWHDVARSLLFLVGIDRLDHPVYYIHTIAIEMQRRH
jgi:hypothetical protein